MTFETSASRTAASIGNIVVTLKDATEGASPYQAALFNVRVLDQNGRYYDDKQGSLVPHIAASTISQLQSFMADIRTQAESEILP